MASSINVTRSAPIVFIAPPLQTAVASNPGLPDALQTALDRGPLAGRQIEAVGVSRVTLWRQGVTKDVLVGALLERLSQDYRDTMWPVLTADANGRDRLALALRALCQVADRHLELLLISDEVFHRAPGDFLTPLTRALRDGYEDGSIRRMGVAEDAANAIFNTVCWSYVHLRARHRWSAQRARRVVLDLVSEGYASSGVAAAS